MKFKEIKAVYNTIDRKGNPCEIRLKRTLSPCSAYGDRSSHSMYVNGELYRLYDTRYDQINTDKDGWLHDMMEYILKPDWLGDSGAKIELVYYEERFIEVE